MAASIPEVVSGNWCVFLSVVVLSGFVCPGLLPIVVGAEETQLRDVVGLVRNPCAGDFQLRVQHVAMAPFGHACADWNRSLYGLLVVNMPAAILNVAKRSADRGVFVLRLDRLQVLHEPAKDRFEIRALDLAHPLAQSPPSR